MFTLGRHSNFTGETHGTARFVVYCTCAKYRVVEYYRVCRFRDVILEWLFNNEEPKIYMAISTFLQKSFETRKAVNCKDKSTSSPSI